MNVRQKLVELVELIRNPDSSLESLLLAAIQIAELRSDSENRLLFEYHLYGLRPELGSTFQLTSPIGYQEFFLDRKRQEGEQSLTGSSSFLESLLRDTEKDIEAALEEVKRVKADTPASGTYSEMYPIGIANRVLAHHRTLYNEIKEILVRIRLRVASYAREIESEFIGSDEFRSKIATTAKTANSRRVFIVHGHDEGTKQSVARFLESLDLEPIILHELASRGSTLIEKFEQNSDVAFAIVLLTDDDVGNKKSLSDVLNPRARQNVVLELGFFYGRLTRKYVCALLSPGVEKPSDIDGIVYVPLDPSGAWKLEIAKELRAAGLDVDMNKLR